MSDCFTKLINGCTLGMGRRKLRFARKKNHERNKYGYGLRVKVPLEVLKPSQLIVQLPISAYTSATVPDAAALRSRLGKSNLVPSGWTVAEEGSQPLPGICPPLVLYKLQFLQVLVAPTVTFTLSVDDQCMWTLRLETSEINPESCQLLRGYTATLSCVDEVMQLLSRIDGSAFCVGNADGKFSELVDSHKGTFRDQSGRQLFCTMRISLFNWYVSIPYRCKSRCFLRLQGVTCPYNSSQ